jgi:hypothetical protein
MAFFQTNVYVALLQDQNDDAIYSSFPGAASEANFTFDVPSGQLNVGDIVKDDFGFTIGEYKGSLIVDGLTYLAFDQYDGNGNSSFPTFLSLYADSPDPANFVGTEPSQINIFSLSSDPLLVCFLEGTRIATPTGERAVESLAIGELVLTADGRAVPVKWVGRQRIRNHAILASPKLEPVCITAGALGNGLPHSDLFVTAAHGMVWEGLVVNAGALVNGTTIHFVPLSEMPEVFTWYHIETEGHEEILAHGAPTETFVDYVGRSHFDNHQEYLDLYGAERIIPEMKRPRVSAQRMLPDHLRARLGLPAHGAAIAAEAEAVLRRLKAA